MPVSAERRRSAVEARGLSPTQKVMLQRCLLLEMLPLMQVCERYYLSHAEQEQVRDLSVTRERYAAFEAWLEKSLKETKFPVHVSMADASFLSETASKIVVLYEGLQALVLNRPLSPTIRKKIRMPNEFILEKKDLPIWNVLPSEEELKREFNLDVISDDVYREGSKIDDPQEGFVLTKEHLDKIGYATDDSKKQDALLDSIQEALLVEELPPMHLFSVAKLIKRKKKEIWNHPDCVSTEEIFEAFDEENVRPATLKELLVFSKKYWKPKADRKNPLTKEEKAQHVNASYVCAAASVFNNSGTFYISGLHCDNDDERSLGEAMLFENWDEFISFLVCRK